MYDNDRTNDVEQPTGGKYPAGEERSMPAEQDLESKIEALSAELDETKREKGQFQDMAQRLQADFLNFKRRTADEREELQKYAGGYIITRLLPVLDEFELAINHANKNEAEAQWLQGVKLIHRKLFALLESHGVKRIEALGKEFDPFEHEALGEQESPDAKPGDVLAVAREGYRLYERILRPAQVIVAKGPEQPSLEDEALGEEKEEK